MTEIKCMHKIRKVQKDHFYSKQLTKQKKNTQKFYCYIKRNIKNREISVNPFSLCLTLTSVFNISLLLTSFFYSVYKNNFCNFCVFLCLPLKIFLYAYLVLSLVHNFLTIRQSLIKSSPIIGHLPILKYQHIPLKIFQVHNRMHVKILIDRPLLKQPSQRTVLIQRPLFQFL